MKIPFLCHSGNEEDNSLIKQLEEKFLLKGIPIYIAERHPEYEKNLWPRILEQLNNSTCCLCVLWTKSAVTAKGVQIEIAYAVAKEVPIIVIQEEDVELTGLLRGRLTIRFSRQTIGKAIEHLIEYISERKYISKSTLITTDKIRIMEQEADYITSAPTCVFLAGDWSVLITKLALLLPLHLRVKTIIIPNKGEKISFYAYEQKNSQNIFWLNNKYTDRISNCLSEYVEFIKKGWDVYFLSSVPYGSILHEVESSFLCLASAICVEKRDYSIKNIERETVKILSRWYRAVSWSTVICSAEAQMNKILYFDRTKDGNIDLLNLAGDDYDRKNFDANCNLDRKSIKTIWMPFDVSRISLLYKESPEVDIPELQNVFRSLGQNIIKEQFEQIITKMKNAIQNRDITEIGKLMYLHQILLSVAGLSTDEYDKIFAKLYSLKEVLGCKFSCSRRQGGIVVFSTEKISLPDFINLGNTIKPTEGLVIEKPKIQLNKDL